MKFVSFLAFRQTIHSFKKQKYDFLSFFIRLTQICPNLTSNSNHIMLEKFGDVKFVTELNTRSAEHPAVHNAVQCTTRYNIIQMHNTVRIENLYDPRSYFIEIFVLTFKQLVDTFFNYIMQDMRL